jgi:hypothetical protein
MQKKGRNCLMPALNNRLGAPNNSLVYGTPSRGGVEVERGEVTFAGCFAGTCSIITSLGRFDARTPVKDLIDKVQGDIVLARQMLAAMSSDHITVAKCESVAQWRCAAYRRKQAGTGLIRPTGLEYQSLTMQYGEDPKFVYNSNPAGKAFLALLSNSIKVTPIMIFTEDDIPEGRLLAVDLNAKTYNSMRNGGKKHVFIILSVPPDGERNCGTLHKVGVSSSVYVPDDNNLEKAKEMNGHVFDRPIERVSVGGEGCWYCSSQCERSNALAAES